MNELKIRKKKNIIHLSEHLTLTLVGTLVLHRLRTSSQYYKLKKFTHSNKICDICLYLKNQLDILKTRANICDFSVWGGVLPH